MTECKAENCCKERNGCYYTDYCSYHRECLDKLFSKNSSVKYDNIRELETFETWFNKNCGYVVNYDYSSSAPYYTNPYYIWIVVYEPAVRSMGENLTAILYNTCYNCSSSARNVAQELKNKLQNDGFDDTPTLEVHPEAKNWKYFSSLIKEPYVVERNLPIRTEVHPFESNYMLYRENAVELFLTKSMRKHYPDNPDSYLKPLDIVKVGEGNYKHVGVYLGNNEVCHFSKRYKGVRVHSWSHFLEDFEKGSGEIICYHPMIPFKSYSKIARQIAWAEERFWENNYVLNDRNCEHFANMIVYGINYSEQVEANKTKLTAPIDVARGFIAIPTFGLSLIGGRCTVNNNKGSTIKLVDEMSESNGILGYTDGYHSRAKEILERIEVPPKQNEWDCKIM